MSVSGSNSCYPTGMGKYDEQFDDKDCKGLIPFPCCANGVVECWQDERDDCYEGKIFSGCCYGIGLRLARVATTAIDIASGTIAAPLVCVGGITISCVACTIGGATRGIGTASSCCASPEWKETVDKQGNSCILGSGDMFINSLKISGLFFLNVLNGAIRLPINLVAPEISEALCWQEESNLLLNKYMKCTDYISTPPQAPGMAPAVVVVKPPEQPPRLSTGSKINPSGTVDE